MNITDAPVSSPSAARRWTIAVIAIAVFFWLDTFHLDLFRAVAGHETGAARVAALAVLGYGHQLIVPVLVAAVLFGPSRAFDALGINRPILTAFKVAALGTLILPIGYAVIASFAPPDRFFLVAMQRAILPGLGEELLYRAFLFGFLFRFAGLGFLPAALLGAALFGVAHLYQGDSVAEAAGIVALTGLGGLWFAWLYAEWNYNLWVPVFFHLLMNLYWEMFAVGDNALGPVAGIVLRLAVIVISIVITIVAIRGRGGQRIVRGRRWLWPAAAAARPADHGRSRAFKRATTDVAGAGG